MTYGWWRSGDGLAELCDECGFDSGEQDDFDRGLDLGFADLQRLAQHCFAARRPDPEVWSGREYGNHCVEVSRYLLELVARATDHDLVPPADLGSARVAAAALVSDLSDRQYAIEVPTESPVPVTVWWAVAHLLHDLRHHALDIRRGYARLTMLDLAEVHVYRR